MGIKCKKCGSEFPFKMRIDGKIRNLKNRKFCLDCSPFGLHNTSQNPDDWLTDPKARKRRWVNKKVSRYRRRRKMKLVDYKGGQCSICGYNKPVSRAYAFHHRDPSQKEFELNSGWMTVKSWSQLTFEADKCDILCVLCHAELHDQLYIEEVKKIDHG